jgi:hypothetical protein
MGCYGSLAVWSDGGTLAALEAYREFINLRVLRPIVSKFLQQESWYAL